MVPLPNNTERLLEKVTHCLITHQHPDHLDEQGIKFLEERQIPVLCSSKDEQDLTTEGLNIDTTLNYWETVDFADIRVTGIPALHGYGFVTKLMGNVIGFYLEPPEEPSIYVSSDTIYTEAVHKVLTEFQPDISVAACGSAQFDILGPLLMTMDDIIKFITHAPGKVIANHLEAINHCPTTREELRQQMAEDHFEDKVWIPEDGDTIDWNAKKMLQYKRIG